VTARKLILPMVVLLTAALAFGALMKHRIDPALCAGCGDCFRICPTRSITIVDGTARIDANTCIGCGQCLGVCTHDAVR